MRLAVVLMTVAACSAPAQLAELSTAEQHERAGDHDAALRDYALATETCQTLRPPRRRRASCASAHFGRAELLDYTGRKAEAAAAYEAIFTALPDDPVAISRALYRAGRLHLSLGAEERAYFLLWKTITDYPDEGSASDALKVILSDGRGRDPVQLYLVLGQLAEALMGTGVGDNLLYALADMAENDFSDPATALGHYDRLAAAYPSRAQSGLYDDALWHGARLARALGDAPGAVARYQALLATREVAFGIGSYFSVWLDDAQLELGRVLRDDLGDLPGAAAAFAGLPRLYPHSILRASALYEAAVTYHRMGARGQACQALAQLADAWPDSRFELEKGPALRAELECPS